MSLKYIDGNGNENSIAGIGQDGSQVSVTRNLTSGTKIASISVDGTVNDLYAPAARSC